MKPLVSIIVPVYNMENSLAGCVESLVKQDYENTEIILVDDGSKDNSFQVCKDIAKKYPSVKCFHTENQGSGPARNYGIAQSQGEYLYFPDADDYLAPHAVSVMADTFQRDGTDLVVFGFRTLDHTGKTELGVNRYTASVQLGDDIRNDYSEYMGIGKKWGIQGAPWNKMFRRSIVEEYGVEYPPLRRHQDEGFICRYMCYAKKVSFIEDILYTYYSNDLKTEWKKYPVDYVESVVGLYKIRKETILTWNPNDTKTRQIVEQQYINNFIKSLELTFSPKAQLTSDRARKNKIKEMIDAYDFRKMHRPEGLGKYQTIVFGFIAGDKLGRAYSVMKLKVHLEKLGLIRFLKR